MRIHNSSTAGIPMDFDSSVLGKYIGKFAADLSRAYDEVWVPGLQHLARMTLIDHVIVYPETKQTGHGAAVQEGRGW